MLRMRPCRNCGKMFFICKCCDRGHAYCCDACGLEGYARNNRKSSREFRKSEEGRLDHRDAERRRRERKKKELDRGVADRTSDAKSSCGSAVAGAEAPAEVAGVTEAPTREERDERKPVRLENPVRCIVCGRESHWVVWSPVPRWHRPVRGYPRC